MQHERALADRVSLEPARAAAGSLVRVLLELAIVLVTLSVLTIIDYSGGMVVMERVAIPAGLPPNEIRYAGALALGLLVVALPIVAGWSYHGVRSTLASGTTAERRAAATRIGAARRRAATLIVVAFAVVGLIAFARATSSNGAESAAFGAPALVIEPLGWEALLALGAITILAALALESYVATRTGAYAAHWAAVLAGGRARRGELQVRRAERRLASDAAAWRALCGDDERALRDVSTRLRLLHDEWRFGASQLVVDMPLPTPVVDEVRPAALRDDASEEDRRMVDDLEREAARLLWSVDPFAVVLPRRDPPPVLRATNQMIGVDDGHHG